jgi:hypothetical protein
LPGGLSVWRARWFVLWYRGRVLRAVLGKLFGVGLPVLIGIGAEITYHDLKSRVLALVFFALALAQVWPGGRNYRRGAPVTAETQPALNDVIERVAERLRVPAPDRMWLVGFAPLARLKTDGRRCYLRLGVAAVACLTRAQLEAVVAHELVLLRYRHPWLVLRLREAYLDELEEQDDRGRRARRNLRILTAFWSTVEGDSDIAATMFVPAEQAAAALVVLDHVALANLDYALELRVPRHAAIEDVDDGWLRYVEHGDAESAEDDGHAYTARFHASLAAPVTRVGELRLELPADRVVVGPMEGKDRRRLAEQSLVVTAKDPRWYTFTTAPQEWWVKRAEDDAQGRSESEEFPLALHRFAEWRLLVAGWRHEHPAVRTVLISPEGERVDLSQMDNPAVRALIAPTLVS